MTIAFSTFVGDFGSIGDGWNSWYNASIFQGIVTSLPSRDTIAQRCFFTTSYPLADLTPNGKLIQNTTVVGPLSKEASC